MVLFWTSFCCLSLPAMSKAIIHWKGFSYLYIAQKNLTLVTLAPAGQKEFKKLILREPGRTVCHKEGGNIICGTKLIYLSNWEKTFPWMLGHSKRSFNREKTKRSFFFAGRVVPYKVCELWKGRHDIKRSSQNILNSNFKISRCASSSAVSEKMLAIEQSRSSRLS